ncbi:glycosyltransferase family 25 protein [Aquamicrobium ahrensii]|uniref:Glycosyl transferase family 25 n=1 Tax=Aquamicrobium ahrensii TaxID=469551 RepID=A0ABV2KGW8_9HYPH
MRIFCVNLDRSTERWASIERQASNLGLEIERFSAVDGSAMKSLPDFPIATGAIGCFLSHHKIWKLISDGQDEYALILEDDALLSASLPDFLRNISWIPKDADLVHLGGSDPRCRIAGLSRPAIGRKIYKCIGCTGTEGYIISKRCAGILHCEMISIDREFDQVLFNGGRPDLKTYKIFPALCTQDRANLPRIIDRGIRKVKTPAVNKIKREVVRGVSKFVNLFRLRRRAFINYE